MQKCHAKRNLDLDLCDGFEWRGQSRLCGRRRKGRGKGRIILEDGGERKGVIQAFQPHFITMLNGN